MPERLPNLVVEQIVAHPVLANEPVAQNLARDLLDARRRLQAISTEALGRDLPTVRLAHLIAGDEAALDQPCTPPGTSGDVGVDAARQAQRDLWSVVELLSNTLRELVEAQMAFDALPAHGTPKDNLVAARLVVARGAALRVLNPPTPTPSEASSEG